MTSPSTPATPNETARTLREFILAFADDEHLIGQQHTEWIGVTPFLEEDLAFSSIGQDELGHAVMLYELVCEIDGIEPTDAAIDALAYGRGATEYRSSAFTEWGTTDWAEALMRHWVYDMVEDFRWQTVSASTYLPLASAAVRAQREETFHRRHAHALVESLCATPARVELERGLDVVLAKLPSLFTPVENEAVLVEAGIISASLSTMAPAVSEQIGTLFGGAVFGGAGSGNIAKIPEPETPENSRMARSEYFAPLMMRMREVLDLDLDAVW